MADSMLRRYTNLASAMHILHNNEITLLNPQNWDDRNDAFIMSEYKKRSVIKTILALCFAESSETYHHWRVFSSGGDGVCIVFKKNELIDHIKESSGCVFRSVSYKPIKKILNNGVIDAELPFLKRIPYEDEQEFRVIYTDYNNEKETHAIPISIKTIDKIYLSPWMPVPLKEAVKKTLKGIKGCGRLKIYRSGLIESERWKKAINPNLMVDNSE